MGLPRPVTRIFVPPLETPAPCRVRLAATTLRPCENFAEYRIRLFLPYILRSTPLLGATGERARRIPKRFLREATDVARASQLRSLIDRLTPLVPSCLRVDDGMVRRSDFWQVTCFCSRGMRNSMLEAAVRTENDQCLRWSTTKPQLGNCSTFCHSAYRLFIVVPSDCWGMRLTQRMRCRKPCWPLTNI